MIVNPFLNASYDIGPALSGLSAFLFPCRENLFAGEFRKLSQIDYICTTNWGRTALFIALKSLNTKDKRVAVNAYTSPTVAATIRDAGYTPIPFDINLDNLGINLESLRRVISEGIGALIVTHLFGFPDEMDILLKIAKEKDIIVIEDCANSLGTFHADKHTGTFGDISFFSFRAGKPLGTGGGLLCINNTELQNRALAYCDEIKKATTILSLCKIEIEKLFYKIPLYGLFTRPLRDLCKNTFLARIIFKGTAVDIYSKVSKDKIRKMSQRQLSMAYCSIKIFIKNGPRREEICNLYRKKLSGVKIPVPGEKGKCNNFFFPVILPSQNALIKAVKELRRNNIDVSRFHYSAPFLAYNGTITRDNFPNTYVLCERLINLPVLCHKNNLFYSRIIKIINENIL